MLIHFTFQAEEVDLIDVAGSMASSLFFEIMEMFLNEDEIILNTQLS